MHNSKFDGHQSAQSTFGPGVPWARISTSSYGQCFLKMLFQALVPVYDISNVYVRSCVKMADSGKVVPGSTETSAWAKDASRHWFLEAGGIDG